MIRFLIGIEHRCFSDSELRALLSADLPLRTAAVRVATKATNIGLEVWEPAARQYLAI